MAKKAASTNKPSHVLKMKARDQNLKDAWVRVGAAWPTEEGEGLKLYLDKGTVLDWHDSWQKGEFLLILYPNEDKK